MPKIKIDGHLAGRHRTGVLMAICDHEPHLLTDRGVRLIRPSYRNRRAAYDH